MSKRIHKKRNRNSEYDNASSMNDEETMSFDTEDESDTGESEDWETFINGGEKKDDAEESSADSDEADEAGTENDGAAVAEDTELTESLKRAVVEALSDDVTEANADDEATVSMDAAQDADNVSLEKQEENTEAVKQTEEPPADSFTNPESEAQAVDGDSAGKRADEGRETENQESGKKKNVKAAAEADVRKEAARVAKDRREREKNKEIQRTRESDEKRELRHKRRIRNQVISYLTIILFVLVLLAGAFLVYWMYFRKTEVQQPTDGKITVSEGTEQTEDIINDMLGMEDDVSEPEAEPVVEEIPVEPEEDLLGDYVDGIISGMTIEEKIAGLFIVTPESITGTTAATLAGDTTRAALEKYCVGGIIYSAKNITGKDQFDQMIEKTSGMVKYPTFFAVAEEGGSVAPLATAGYYEAEDTASHIAASEDVTGAYSAGVSIGFAMNQIGLNLNLAPVADLSITDGNILGSRAYSDTAGNTAGYVISMMQGIEDGNVTSCLKYFPGIGMVTEDPANGRVVSDRTDDDFSSGELLVYQAAIENGANMIMMSDVVYSAYSDAPATISNDVVTGLLRERLGFEGVILSANLSDAAISQYYGSDEAAIAALKAGCDMIMCPENFNVAYDGVLKAVEDGVISSARVDDALARILRVKYARNFE